MRPLAHLLALASVVAQATAQAQRALPIHLLSPADGYRQSDYAFLASVIGNRSIVQLGESIHLTEEFPQARLNIVRYLHETSGFDAIAFEGSAVNAWLAMEALYASPNEASAVGRAQEIAWFPLWDTRPMREVMGYIASTQHSAAPLYLTSFDMQAGQSRATGARVFDQLFVALSAYEPAPAGSARWKVSFDDARRCSESLSRAAFDSATAQFGAWVAHLAPIVGAKRAAVHVAALRRLPDDISQLARLCDAARNVHTAGARQIARDSMAALNVIQLRDSLAPDGKLVLWAHHAHVYYNSLNYPLTSMGQRLRAMDSSSLYTIGLFAGHGSALDVQDGDRVPLARRRLRRASDYTAENALEGAAHEYRAAAAFIDLSRLDSSRAPEFFARGATRFEVGGSRPSVLARDFDGALYIDAVHPPRLLFGGVVLAGGALMKGLLYDEGIGIAVLAIGLIAAITFVRRRRSPGLARL